MHLPSQCFELKWEHAAGSGPALETIVRALNKKIQQMRAGCQPASDRLQWRIVGLYCSVCQTSRFPFDYFFRPGPCLSMRRRSRVWVEHPEKNRRD
eukprot:159874-Rhodomonas_salina.3